MTERAPIVGRCVQCGREFVSMPKDGLDHFGFRFHSTALYPVCHGEVKPMTSEQLQTKD